MYSSNPKILLMKTGTYTSNLNLRLPLSIYLLNLNLSLAYYIYWHNTTLKYDTGITYVDLLWTWKNVFIVVQGTRAQQVLISTVGNNDTYFRNSKFNLLLLKLNNLHTSILFWSTKPHIHLHSKPTYCKFLWLIFNKEMKCWDIKFGVPKVKKI